MTTSNVTSGQNPIGLVVSGGEVLNVLSGGTITGADIQAGGTVTVSVGGVDFGATIATGGFEFVYGSANGDRVAGVQTVSTGTAAGIITNETVLNGGVVSLAVKTTSAVGTTVDSGGALDINGNISATDTTLSGGTIDLESAKATLTGGLVFAAGGTLLVTGNTSAGSGDLAVISGFGAGDVIDMTAATAIGGAATTSLTLSTSGGNTVAVVSGGGATDMYYFSGTAIAATLTLTSDNAGGEELIVTGAVSAVTSVGSGATASGLSVSTAPLTVYNGGTIVAASILSGGLVTISSGGLDSGSTISGGGRETVLGAANADSVFGAQLVASGGVATGETVQTGGTLTLSGGGTATNTTIAGGSVVLQSPTDTLAGSLNFDGPGTIDVTALNAAGDQAVISGFYAGDVLEVSPFGSGTVLKTSTNAAGNTVATLTSGTQSESFTLAGAIASNLTLSTATGVADIEYAGPPTTTAYTAGDLVLSVYGDGSGTGSYALDQAAPITLEEITQSGQIVSVQELPQTTIVVNGTTEYAISGEYESASEGLLTLAGNGESVVIAGYGVNAVAFDAPGAASIYGTSALGQTSSLLGGQYTTVERVVADISYNASVDTSTSLSGVFNTNNPRSVYTVNGTSFYLGGQGNGTDGTEGVFLAADGASTATPIDNTKTDVREVEVYNGQLYVSIDSKLNGGAGLYDFGSTLPSGQTAPVELPGIGASITLSAGQANVVNGADVGSSVNLSPEQYFFADPTTLYIADGGDPKEGGLGDGGLQKWSLVNGTWDLDYTLSEGLDMVPDTDADGTTGLVGLTGTVEGGNVVLYATNETVAETDQTYLYSITDSLAATSLPGSESFTLLDTAAPDTLIRGVSFAPSASSTTPVVSTALIISGGVSSGGLSVTGGGSITVLNGGTIAGTSLLSGGVATISSGGVDSATAVAHGASETVLGTAGLDIIDGALLVSGATAVVSGEVVENGGSLELFLAGAIASGTTINRNGGLYISGHADAVNTVIDAGGLVVLESPKAELSGSLDFSGSGGVLRETVVVSAVSAGYGDVATISGFGAGDVIDERAFATASLTTTVSGGLVIATLTSGTAAEVFSFAGSAGVSGAAYASGLSSATDNAGGVEIIYTPPPPNDIIVSGGATSGPLSITAGNEIIVLSGGTMSGITVYSGGSAVISAGGEDLSSTILAGGYETVSGDAKGDQVYGTQLVTSGPSGASLPATIENETVFNGGSIELYLKPDIGTGIIVSSGGSLLLSGNVSAVDTTLEGGAFMALQSPKAVISGGLVFSGAATLDITAVTSSGFGGSAGLITGWQAGDVIDETLTNPATAGLSLTTSGGNTVATITGATYPDVFVFSGTAVAPHIALQDDSDDGVELVYQAACMVTGTLIRTVTGERPIESLQIGEMLLTESGEARPLRWIGRRALDCTRHPTPEDVWPVLVQQGAFGEGRPARDLWLSPGHNIAAAGVLMPVRALQNGLTVRQVRLPRVEYWHVELDSHDIIFTEGLPSETYLDTGNRCAFVGGGAYLQAHPDFAPKHWTQTSLPLRFDGEEVLHTRALLRRRADELGHAVTDDADLHIVADGRRIAPMALGAQRLAFLLPEGCETITLESRCFVPAYVDPTSDDGRTLGVCVGRLQLDGADVDLADPAVFGAGWHGMEALPALRWTMGRAALPARARLVVVELAGRGFYWSPEGKAITRHKAGE